MLGRRLHAYLVPTIGDPGRPQDRCPTNSTGRAYGRAPSQFRELKKIIFFAPQHGTSTCSSWTISDAERYWFVTTVVVPALG